VIEEVSHFCYASDVLGHSLGTGETGASLQQSETLPPADSIWTCYSTVHLIQSSYMSTHSLMSARMRVHMCTRTRTHTHTHTHKCQS